MGDLREIRKWSPEKMNLRIRELAQGKIQNKELDELIVICLEVLRIVVNEQGWNKSPLDLFVGAFGSLELTGPISKPLVKRFLETKVLLAKFESGDPNVKETVRPELVARGML